MKESERLTVASECFDGFTLKELCESCGEMGCGEYCEIMQGSDCSTCPIQKAFNRLAQYEDTGLSPESVSELAKENTVSRKALELAIANHSTNEKMINRLMRHYLKEAREINP
ncbi:hypothetical protein [Desulfitobacterium hafniense]|uniref:hypothetical protein n=1 Tax=Desulfitobacterium hafniense TaxID=49338 RepID=UPI00036C5011|nr:hypothetical protein [Desulfitobacterium hafniense]